MHEGNVDWKHIGEEGFNRLIEVLLVRIFHHPPKSVVDVVDGRGGDGGVDVAVYVEEKISHIFQLKYFPEGFSGGFKTTRRRQIKESFNVAWGNHEPPLWTLVIPCNPTVNERKYVTTLGAGKNVTPQIWGTAHLDEKLAEHQDIRGAATQELLLERLSQINMEQAALAGPEDLAKRMLGLRRLADARSMYWTVDVQTSEKGVVQTLRPKHPRAAELEPLRVDFTLLDNGSGVTKDMRQMLDYGIQRDIIIPGEAIRDFIASGPDWFRGERSIDRLEIRGEGLLPKHEQVFVTLEFLTRNGYTRSSHQGYMQEKGQGTQGFFLKFRFYEILEFILQIPYNNSGAAKLTLSYSFSGALVSDARDVVRLLHDLSSGLLMQLLFEEQKLFNGSLNDNGPILDPSVELLIEDLAVLELRLNAKFKVPAETSHHDRVLIRVARLFTEGKATWMPPGTVLTAVLSPGLDEKIESWLSNGIAITMPIPNFSVEIQGSRFNLGKSFMYHPWVVVRDAVEVKKSLIDTRTENLNIVLETKGDSLFWVMPGEDYNEHLPETVAWDLPDIPMPVQLDAVEKFKFDECD